MQKPVRGLQLTEKGRLSARSRPLWSKETELTTSLPSLDESVPAELVQSIVN